MEAAAFEREPKKERPFGVTVLAVLSGISVVLGLLLLLAAANAATGAAIIVLIVTALAAISAYGLWNLRWWAWPLALVTWILTFVDAVAQLASGTLSTNLVIAPLATLYLLRTDIRAAFRRDD